jgi:predicted NBD/HSP70 family sugar kinase
MRINNNNFQKNSNISRIIEEIWKKSQISRIDIARELKLYRSTVSNIINSLLDNKIILEAEEGTSLPQGGRKPIYLSMNPQFGCVIGIEIQPHNYWAVAVNLFGDMLFSKEGIIPEEIDDDDHEKTFVSIIDWIMLQIASDIKELQIPALGICFGIPGIVNVDKGIIIRSDPFFLKNYDFSKQFDMRYNLPVLIENDANCCAWLQLTANRQSNLRDFISVLAEYHTEQTQPKGQEKKRAGMGVGLAISLEGKVRYGKNYGMGEYVSISWNEKQLGQTGLPNDVMKNTNTDDDCFTQWATDLCKSLTLFIPLIAPEKLFIHGLHGQKTQLLEKIARTQVPQLQKILEITNCELVISDDTNYEIALGAASMFLQKLFSVPDMNEVDSHSRFDWDAVFEIAHRKNNTSTVVSF